MLDKEIYVKNINQIILLQNNGKKFLKQMNDILRIKQYVGPKIQNVMRMKYMILSNKKILK